MFNGISVVRVTRATPVLPPGVTDDTPDFNREMVMLDISGQLYGESASRVIDVSKIIGSLMTVNNNNCTQIKHFSQSRLLLRTAYVNTILWKVQSHLFLITEYS